jgi:endonuclease/exonuclease/phosphatase family metal-dependent hydrolase
MQKRSIRGLPQLPEREPRIVSVVHSKIGGKGPEIVFASTHLDHQLEEVRVEQAQKLNSILSTNEFPVLVAGDFNSAPESRTIQTLAANWIDAASNNPQPTIPSGTPKKRIDYVLLGKGSRWKVIHTEVINEPVASDHRPVLAVVELEGAARP